VCSMKYTITSNYCFLDNGIVEMFYINGVPFTFDDISEQELEDPLTRVDALSNTSYTSDELYRSSSYLMDEQCHPLLFELELVNPEALPVD